MAHIEQLPIPPGAIKDGALFELNHVGALVRTLSPHDWLRPSAVAGWTVGGVVAHLDLFVGMYGRLLGAIPAGGGSSRTAKLIGWLTSSILPSATPAFDIINGALPRAMDRMLTQERLKRQFAAGARSMRDRLLELGSDDHCRTDSFECGPYSPGFYLGIIVNELAVHGWDIESRTRRTADLSDAASGILPWFYWSATRLMLHPHAGTRGTIQVVLSEPQAAMWWSVGDGSLTLGHALAPDAEAEIGGPSSTYALALAGRLQPAEALRTGLAVYGDRGLAERFLQSWHLI